MDLLGRTTPVPTVAGSPPAGIFRPIRAALRDISRSPFSSQISQVLKEQILTLVSPMATTLLSKILQDFREDPFPTPHTAGLVRQFGLVLLEARSLGDDLLWACHSMRVNTYGEQSRRFEALENLLKGVGFECKRPIIHNTLQGFLEPRSTNLICGEVQHLVLGAFRRLGARFLELAPVEQREVVEVFAPKNDIIGLREFRAQHLGEKGAFQRGALRRDHTPGAARRVGLDSKDLAFPLLTCQYAYCFRSEEFHDNADGRLRGFIQADLDLFDNRRTLKSVRLRQDVRMIGYLHGVLCCLLDDVDTATDEEPASSQVLFRISNRKILQGALTAFGTRPDQINRIVMALDGLTATSKDDFLAALPERLRHLDDDQAPHAKEGPIFLTNEAMAFLWELRQIRGEPEAALQQLNLLQGSLPGDFELVCMFRHGVRELQEVMGELSLTPEIECVVDAGLSRTCPLYTGTEFEATWVPHPEVGSIAAGGRFDDVVERMTGLKIRGTGGAIGVSRIINSLLNRRSCRQFSSADILVTVGTKNNTFYEQSIIRDASTLFRGRNIRALDLYPDDTETYQQMIDYARINHIRFIYFADRLKMPLYEVDANSWSACDPNCWCPPEFG